MIDQISHYLSFLPMTLFLACAPMRLILEISVDKLDFKSLSYNPNISLEFFKDHEDDFSICIFLERCNLKIIEYLMPKIFFVEGSQFYIDCMNSISQNMNLSEEFLQTHAQRVSWKNISKMCSLDILLKFENLIDFKIASMNKNLTSELVSRHLSEINWFKFYWKQQHTDDFLIFDQYASMHTKYLESNQIERILSPPAPNISNARHYYTRKQELKNLANTCSVQTLEKYSGLFTDIDISLNKNLPIHIAKQRNIEWLNHSMICSLDTLLQCDSLVKWSVIANPNVFNFFQSSNDHTCFDDLNRIDLNFAKKYYANLLIFLENV